MKKIVLALSILMFVFSKTTFGQIVVFSQTHTVYTPSISADVGTNIYYYDMFSGPGGARTIFRRNNYWYMVYTGYGISDYLNIYYENRTVHQHPTINPPDCATWQRYVSAPSPLGYQWIGFPGSAPALPNGSISTIPISGSSVGINPSSSPVIGSNFIDLANQNLTEIGVISNQPGRILYNTCQASVQFNNGTAWKSVWPNFNNYELNQNQALNLGDAFTQILGTNNYGTTQMIFKTSGTEKISIGKNPVTDKSIINLKGSIGTPVVTASTDYTLGDNNHIFIHTGSVAHTITLSAAFNTGGRQYIIANPSTNTLSFLPTVIIGLGSTLAAGQNITIVSDGSNWYKVN